MQVRMCAPADKDFMSMFHEEPAGASGGWSFRMRKGRQMEKHEHGPALHHFDANEVSHELLDEPHEKYGGIAVAIFWLLILIAGLSVIVVAGYNWYT